MHSHPKGEVCGQFTGKSADGVESHCNKPRGHDGSCNPLHGISFKPEPEGRVESELECYCEDGETCETCKPSTPEPVVSASPAEECKYSPSGKHVAPRGICQYCEEDAAAAQPVAANPKAEGLDEFCIRHFGTNEPKSLTGESLKSILGPFFTQVSQPPTDIYQALIEADGMLDDSMYYDKWRKKWNDVILSAPVTPVSPTPDNCGCNMCRAYGISGRPDSADWWRSVAYGLGLEVHDIKRQLAIEKDVSARLARKEVEQAIRREDAEREIERLKLVTPVSQPHMQEVSRGILTSRFCTCPNQADEDGSQCPICGKQKSVTPVSGNGTEPPDHKELSEVHLLHRLWTKAVGTQGYIKDEWRRMEAIVLRAQPKDVAGAASHDGQGWDVAKLREALTELYGEWNALRRVHVTGLQFPDMDRRIREALQPLPAPPSEADGPQEGKLCR